MTIYMSSGAFRTRSVNSVIDDAVRLGVKRIEMSSGLDHEPNLEDALRRGLNKGLQFLVHNYFPAPADSKVLNLTSSDPDGLAWSLNHCRYALDLAKLVNCDFYSLHSGYAVALSPQMLGKPDLQAEAFGKANVDREGAYQLMIQSVREVADYAAANGKELLLENNVISPVYLKKAPLNPLLMTNAEEIVRFMTDVDRPNVGFLIDVGHTKVSATALNYDAHKFLDTVEAYIRALHLSDNDGQEDQNLPFNAESWFAARLKDFADLPMVIEAYELADDQMLQQLELAERLTA
ncbi:MAG: sugar phosphate isomerase/epimerase [Rhodospirillaceae bacterium]|nr:sugar phosphate isomerase/epimerase [Rhodospirillaceae bacterium]